MEPHLIDPAQDLGAPHHDGVYGPLLWIDVTEGEVWQEASKEQGSGTKAVLVWVGTPVVVVIDRVEEGDRQKVSDGVRAYLRRGEPSIVFQGEFLPNKVGVRTGADASPAIPRRELARAQAFALIQSEWLDREQVTIELDGERFDFDVGEAPDEEGRLITLIE